MYRKNSVRLFKLLIRLWKNKASEHIREIDFINKKLGASTDLFNSVRSKLQSLIKANNPAL